MTTLEAEESRIHAAYQRRRTEAPSYSWFDDGHLFMLQEVERHMLAALRRANIGTLQGKNILEIGCGNGFWLRQFIQWGAEPAKLTGVELLADRLTQARALTAPAVTFLNANAAQLPLAEQSFDIILQATVFTSILDPALKHSVAAEMLRLLRPGGVILWYDFRVDNPRNRDVRGIERDEMRRLFPGCGLDLTRLTLVPPLVRRLAPYSPAACRLLSRLPWLCCHYLAALRKP